MFLIVALICFLVAFFDSIAVIDINLGGANSWLIAGFVFLTLHFMFNLPLIPFAKRR